MAARSVRPGCAEFLPRFPLDIADEVLLARIALATGDDELAGFALAATATAPRENPAVRSIGAAAAHVRGLLERDAALREAADLLERGRGGSSWLRRSRSRAALAATTTTRRSRSSAARSPSTAISARPGTPGGSAAASVSSAFAAASSPPSPRRTAGRR